MKQHQQSSASTASPVISSSSTITDNAIIVDRIDDPSRSVVYHPSVWGDYFVKHASDFRDLSPGEVEEHGKLKEEVRMQLTTLTSDEPRQKLELIDAIQRLGVGYHFEKEIDISLQDIHEAYFVCSSQENFYDNDLRTAALSFRLLRQQGCNISSARAFDKFMDREGKFKETLVEDVQGILNLYEASHFGAYGDQVLDEASEFASSHLKSAMALDNGMNEYLAAQVDAALKVPLQKTLPRLEAKRFLSVYQKDESHNKALLKFAKLDFHSVQRTHQKELHAMTRWWKVLDFDNKLSFARDRVVESYFWALPAFYEPQYHVGRITLAKVLAISTVIDDIYDVYGAMDDLRLFTSAVQRWDYNCSDELPPYMKICYEVLLDIYAELQDESERIGHEPYPVQYAKGEMIKMISAYYEEAKWYSNKYVPSTVEEYMKEVGLPTGAKPMMLTAAMAGLPNQFPREHFDWLVSEPPPSMLWAVTIISRLMNDIAGYGTGEKRATAIDCYMKQYGAPKEEAYAEFRKQVEKAWKDLNQEFIHQPSHPAAVPRQILMMALNWARFLHLLYEDDFDWFTNSENRTKDIIRYLFVEPVTLD